MKNFKKLIKEALKPDFLKENREKGYFPDDLRALESHPDIELLINTIEDKVGIDVERYIRGYKGPGGEGVYLRTPSLRIWNDEVIDTLKRAFDTANERTEEYNFEYASTSDWEEEPGERTWDADFAFFIDKQSGHDDDKPWTDPAGGTHYGDEDDPAAAYIEEGAFDDMDIYDNKGFGDSSIEYEIDDYEIYDQVVVSNSLTTDPLNKQGETGVVKEIDIEKAIIYVMFDDGLVGGYTSGAVVFPGDEGKVEYDDDFTDEDYDKWDAENLEESVNEAEELSYQVGDILYKDGREGKVVKVLDDMVNVDFGGGDVYGITFSRIKGDQILDESVNEGFIEGKLEDRNEALYDVLVPRSGKTGTVEGEMLRAINKIVYRFYNDGDKFYEGYGAETAGPSHSYLINSNNPLRDTLASILDKAVHSADQSDGAYERILELALTKVLDYIESKEGNYTESEVDMYDYDSEFEDETQDDSWDEEDDYYSVDDYDDEDEEDQYDHMEESTNEGTCGYGKNGKIGKKPAGPDLIDEVSRLPVEELTDEALTRLRDQLLTTGTKPNEAEMALRKDVLDEFNKRGLEELVNETKYKKGDKVIISRTYKGGVGKDPDVKKGKEKTGTISKRIKKGNRYEYVIAGTTYDDDEIKGLVKEYDSITPEEFDALPARGHNDPVLVKSRASKMEFEKEKDMQAHLDKKYGPTWMDKWLSGRHFLLF